MERNLTETPSAYFPETGGGVNNECILKMYLDTRLTIVYCRQSYVCWRRRHRLGRWDVTARFAFTPC
jgi:hypothetical protein